MAVDLSRSYGLFFDEAIVQLAEVEQILLSIEIDAPATHDALAHIVKNVSGIKFSAANFGFTDVIETIHLLELMLEKVLQNESLLTSEHIDIFLMTKHVLVMVVDGCCHNIDVDFDQVVEVKALLQQSHDALTADTLAHSGMNIDLAKVDQLVSLVDELVMTQAVIERGMIDLDEKTHEGLLKAIEQLQRNTYSLQEAVIEMRMVPIREFMKDFPSMVNALAYDVGKSVDLVIINAEAVVDKGLLEHIIEPLQSLVKHRVMHGIEAPHIRESKGKHGKGTIAISAKHHQDNLVISITDDGDDLNREAIVAQAQSAGIYVDDTMSDNEVYQLIFAQGFSMCKASSKVGASIDQVKRNVNAIGGDVSAELAAKGGASIVLTVPLSIAMLEGLAVSVGSNAYVIPFKHIVEIIRPKKSAIKDVAGEGQMMEVDGEYLPIIILHSIFNIRAQYTNPEEGVFVLVEYDGKKAVLFVDQVVGRQQVVIKRLDGNYKNVTGVAGATLMRDGKVALILDLKALMSVAEANNYLTGALPFSKYTDQSSDKEFTQ